MSFPAVEHRAMARAIRAVAAHGDLTCPDGAALRAGLRAFFADDLDWSTNDIRAMRACIHAAVTHARELIR